VLTRRSFGLLSTGALLSGCATVSATTPAAPAGFTPPLPPRGTRLRLAPVHVDEERVTRVIAGLRPFRPSGFVVRGERLGDKLLVHNYGHGGGGVTLSWGTAELAVDAGFAGPDRDYAVLGCGAVGLATARLLQRRGGRVTIYAEKLPPETTSNIAGGQWWPASVHDDDAASPTYVAQHLAASRLAHRHWQTMLGPHYGVRWIRNYAVSQRSTDPGQVSERDPLRPLAPETRTLGPGEHPFTGRNVRQYDTMMVEPPVYLQAVVEDFLTAGGRISVRRFADRAQVAALSEPVVFNCTGLGAGALFGDAEIMPVKGVLVVLLPQPEVTYNILGGGGYMFPRADGIILGGTFDRGDWTLEPEPDEVARILTRHKALFESMAKG
jgi:glycine/D-amino acid oxidase-like deaminating enzyme